MSSYMKNMYTYVYMIMSYMVNNYFFYLFIYPHFQIYIMVFKLQDIKKKSDHYTKMFASSSREKVGYIKAKPF